MNNYRNSYAPIAEQLQPDSMKSVEYTRVDLENPKEFFITRDGIANSGYETFISVFQRYRCEAGCDVCYIKDRWVGPNGEDYFTKYAPPEITPSHEKKILDAFDHFTTVSTIDDLKLVKNHFPGLYEFYKKHSNKMNLTSMTDMAFIQQTGIALDDLDFQSVYDITFSDYFLQKPKVAQGVIRLLDRMKERYPIVKIRFILSADPLVNRDGTKQVINWAKHNNVYTMGTLDHRGNWNFQHELMTMLDHHEASHLMEEDELHQVYTEVTHLMYDRWVVSFYQSTQDEDLAFYHLGDGMVAADWLEAHLVQKLMQYKRSYEVIKPNEHNQLYVDYFKYITDNVQINKGWNMIPTVMMNKRSGKMHEKLKSGGFVECQFGLVRPEVLTGDAIPIPIYSFNKKSQ